MIITFNKNLWQTLVSVLLIIIFINSTGFSQKKKPTRTNAVPQDTSLTVQEKPKQPEVVSKTNISKYNEDLKIWNRSIDETKTWNRNYKFLLDHNCPFFTQ